MDWNKDYKNQPTNGLLANPRHLVLYPSFSLHGSHSGPAVREGHFVIENGWAEYEAGYHHKRDGAVWQVRKLSDRGTFCPWAAVDSKAIGICIVGIPSYAPPLGSLPAHTKWDSFGGRAVWTTEKQMESLISLCADLCIKYDINPMHRAIETPQMMKPAAYIPAIYQRRRLVDGLLRRSECAFTNLLREAIAKRMISLDF